MGYDKLLSFFTKNLGNNCMDQLNIESSKIKKGLYVGQHIFFDIQFIIYICINEIEQDINKIIKILCGLLYNDKDIILDKINKILCKSEWKNLKISFDGNSVEKIIEIFLQNIDDKLINFILNFKIIKYIKDVINKIHDINFIKSINIFFDGIPTYSKILEQRRRRIKTYVDSLNKKKLFNLYFDKIEDNIIFDEEYKIYYEYKLFINYKYSFNLSMGPYSNTIIFLTEFLKKKLKKDFYNIKIYVNGSNNYGEADFKIFQYILSNKIISEIYIHSCDSDFINLILIFQILHNNHRRNLYFIRYNLKENNYYDIISANKIIILLIEKYKNINLISSDINFNVIYDFLFIILMFGNDIIPYNLELNSELNLKILFSSHYQLYKNNSYIINLASENIINFNNLKIFLLNIKKKNLLQLLY